MLMIMLYLLCAPRRPNCTPLEDERHGHAESEYCAASSDYFLCEPHDRTCVGGTGLDRVTLDAHTDWDYKRKLHHHFRNHTVVHFVRDPLEMVVSGYQYHVGPAEEPWLYNRERREGLYKRASTRIPPDTPYQEALRSSSTKDGIKLELFRIISRLERMCEVYTISKSYPAVATMRLESTKFLAPVVKSLQDWLSVTDRPTLKADGPPLVPSQGSHHVTSKDGKPRLRRLLLDGKVTGPPLRHLSACLDYHGNL